MDVPVARSDPRRTTIIGIAGVVVGIVMIVTVLALNSGGGKTTVGSTSTEFDAGRASDLSARIALDRYPLLVQDPANFSRPLWIQHVGDDPESGWLSFDAAVDGCATTWDVDRQEFTDCSGRHYPADGTGLPPYPVAVANGRVVVNLNRDAASTTVPN
ncbi:MAG: hypothetical protein ABIV94_04950 [Acidimicrobiales bacterium]